MDTLLQYFAWIPFIETGGITMIPLFLCLVMVSAISVERLIGLRRGLIAPTHFLVDLESLARKRDAEGTLLLCRKTPCALANILTGGLRYLRLPRADLLVILESLGRAEAAKLSRALGLLGLLGNVAPLLGLLGTVLGMIKLFAAVKVAGVGDPNFLSGGISEALITTAAGLVIAIPTVVIHRFLNGRAQRLTLEMETIVLETIGHFRGEIDEL